MAPLDFEQYRTLVEQAPSMLWRSGIDGTRHYFNASWLAFTGRSLEQEVGGGWAQAVHPDELERCLEALSDHQERRRPFEIEYRLRRFDGAYRAVIDRGAPCNDGDGSFDGFVGSCVDVDDRRSRQVVASADDFFELSLDNVCVAGLDGYFRRLSPSWTRTLGWTHEEFLSRPVIEFVHPDDREAVLAARQGLREGVPLNALTNRYVGKDGTYRWFSWKSVAHIGRGLVYCVARDVTEQKLAEDSLKQAQELQEKLQRQLIFADRMASVGTLAAGVAHEINNPLACVMANMELMVDELRSLSDGPHSARWTELGEMASDAHVGAERIRKIVQGLKTFSRAGEERRAVIDLQPLLDLSVDLTLNEFRRRGAVLVKDQGRLPLVEADDARLGQVFIHLLINAAQALSEAESAKEIVLVSSTDPDGRAVVEVRDTGAGIPAHLLDRVFDPFFTTRPVGMGAGLGLSFCHNIVTGLGGEITVRSEEGRGTTFRVVLPPAASS